VSTSKQRWAVAALVALVVVLRVALVLAVHGAHPDRAITDDTDGYTEPARALVEGHGFDLAPDTSAPEFQRTPGYPLFVAAAYWLTEPGRTGDTVVVVAQAVLSGLSVLLAILLALRLSASFGVALTVGLAVGFDPLQAAQAGLVVSETLATVLTTLAAYCGVRFVEGGPPALRARWGAACGLSLVAATYVRPTTYYFPLFVLVALGVLALRHRGDRPLRTTIVRAAAAFGIPCIVLLGVWNVRNHARVDSWAFSGLEGTNLYWYRAASVVAARDGTGLEQTQVRLTADLSRGRVRPFDYRAWRSGEPPPEWEHRQGEYYGRARREAIAILRSEPLLTAREYGRGVYGQVVQSGWRSALEYVLGDDPPAVLVAPGLVVVWAIEALAVVGAVAALRRPGGLRAAHVFVVGLATYVILVTAAGPDAGGGYRFRIPIWPLWCVYAGLGLQFVLDLLARRRRPAT
jgi:hypothetical protein